MDTCVMDGCQRARSTRRGLCVPHYKQKWKEARRPPRPTTLQRFAEKIHITDTCWIWTGATDQAGYGVFSHGAPSRGAHRFAYTAMVGEIPPGLHIDHLCAIRNCVNPDHLEAVTPSENAKRSWRNHPRIKEVVTTVIHVNRVEHVFKPSESEAEGHISTAEVAALLDVSTSAIKYRARKLNIGRLVNDRLRLYSDADIERLAAYPKHGENLRRKI